MDISLQIKSLLNEAELYRAQGLFADAKQKYIAALDIIHNLQKLKNKDSLIKAISDKIQSLEEKTEKVETGPSSPELSEKGQDLIKNLFGENDLQKAVALAKFGQFERSIVELEPILKDDRFRLDAAKNIIRCKMAMGSADDAIDQYNQWCSTDLFSTNEMESIRAYLQPILEKRGIDKVLPSPVGEKTDDTEDSGGIEFSMPEPEEEILEITSIGITFPSGTHTGKMVEFDVNFQSGEMLSLIIPKNDKGIIEELNNGDNLEDIQFYSPIAMFSGTAVVANKTKIDSGPKQGDFCLDLKITST
jgi:type I site-specific restriction-modification system R (restriction) subunit